MAEIINNPTRMSRTAAGLEEIMAKANRDVKKARTLTEELAPHTAYQPDDGPEHVDMSTPLTQQELTQAQFESGHQAPPEPQPENLEVPSPSVPDPVALPPQPQQPNISLAIALPQQTRRVRETILPAWYHYQAPNNAGQADPAVVDYIQMVNAALTTAEQAMMTQDVGLMQFAFRTLAALDQVPQTVGQAASPDPT